MIPYFERDLIRKYAAEAREEYSRLIDRPISFPLNLEHMFDVLFGLQIVYDTEGILNDIEVGIIGCLFPEGHPSPFSGKDKLIVVNFTATPDFDPTHYSDQHTIAHEGMGHYILHFLKGIAGEKADRPAFCRTKKKDRLEWQADFAAGELTQPADQVAWLLDGKKSGEIINVDLYERAYRQYFCVTRSGMEARLKALGYEMVNTRNEWAGPVGGLARRFHFDEAKTAR